MKDLRNALLWIGVGAVGLVLAISLVVGLGHGIFLVYESAGIPVWLAKTLTPISIGGGFVGLLVGAALSPRDEKGFPLPWSVDLDE